jgi:methylenetetrahydrofolate reductase (NADPH)
MEEIEDDWPDYMHEFSGREKSAHYVYDPVIEDTAVPGSRPGLKERVLEHWPYKMLCFAHSLFFDKTGAMAPVYRKLAAFLDSHHTSWILKRSLEDPMKILLLSCQSCGDCGIQHAAFLCPESGCPKHTRNGPCGGSRNGACEVYPEKDCIWIRAYNRLEHAGKLSIFLKDKVPPRNWELNRTSSWINFHLGRDHQK